MYPASSVRRAEWSKGRLRLLCEVDASTEVFGASKWFKTHEMLGIDEW